MRNIINLIKWIYKYLPVIRQVLDLIVQIYELLKSLFTWRKPNL